MYAVVFLFFSVSGKCQTYVTSATTSNIAIVSPNQVTNAPMAYDTDMSTFAVVNASSGLIAGALAYNGYIELRYTSNVPANTTSYVKIATEDNLLSSLLGGSLGNLLANVLGAVLLGKQEFTIDAKDGPADTNVVLSGSSNVAGDFATDRLRIVRNAAGDYLVAITPSVPYNRIRITNRLGSTLLGLGNTKTLKAFGAYYMSNTLACGNEPTFTSFSGSGVSLDLLNLSSEGVRNPERAIDVDKNNFSTLNLGLLGVGATIEQTVYFEGLSQSTDVFGVGLSIGADLLELDVLTNIKIIASNGGTVVQTKTLSELLTLNLLTMTGGQRIMVPMTPGLPVDRITVQFSSFLTVALVAQNLNFYGVKKALAMPNLTQNVAICQGSTASLIATTTTGTSLKWYSDVGGTTLLATRASGVVFETPVLSAPQTYYVSQISGTCEGLLRPVTVNVLTIPGAGSIAGEQTVCLGKPSGILTSVTATGGAGISYQWESSLNEIDWTAIQGANLAEYQPESLLKTTFFRRITTISSGATTCSSVPSNSIKITVKNCVVISNPMVRQRIKNGS